MPNSEAQRILIVGPSWVGDMVMAQALFRALKQQRPDAEIHVLAPAWTRPLLARMPEVAASIDLPFAHGALQLDARRRMGLALRGKYQQAIVLPNSLKSALIPFFADIPLRTGWRGEMRFWLLNDIRLLNKRDYPLMVQRFVALAYPPGAASPDPLPNPGLTAASQRMPELLKQFELNRMRPVLVLCPGAEFGPSKRWPTRHYATLAAQRIADGWQVWIMGSNKDAAVAHAIMAELSVDAKQFCHVLAGNTELAEAIDLLSIADAVVSNDSGLMHIAAALGRPLVAVYGSTSPAFTPPLGERVATESIPVDCGPCFKRDCPYGHLKCLEDLSPKQVQLGLDEILQRQKMLASTELTAKQTATAYPENLEP